MREGWYLMNLTELEGLLARWRAGEQLGDIGVPLEIVDALARKRAGNLPDARGRTLRLVLMVDEAPLEERRALYEPDVHERPDWRRPGSKPVHVVPLKRRRQQEVPYPWWEDPSVKHLEAEWQRSGRIAGVPVPEDYRSFVLKAVASLRVQGKEISARAIADSIERWLLPEDAARLRAALDAQEPDPGPGS